MTTEFADEQKSLELAKYFEGLNLLGIKNDHHPSEELLGFFKEVTAKGLVTQNSQLSQHHINKALNDHKNQSDDIAVTEFRTNDSNFGSHAIHETITSKMTNPSIKSASHVIEMGGHWLALTFKKQIGSDGQVINDEHGKPKITAFLADSLPETPAGDTETSFDKNRELLQGYLMSIGVDFQRVKVATQGTEQCGENAVANVLAMEKASYQDLQKHQYDPSQSSLSRQTDIPSLSVEIAPAQIRHELKDVFNHNAKAELEKAISQDITRSQSLTSRFPAVDVTGRPRLMEVEGGDLLGALESQGSSLFDFVRNERLPGREDYPLEGYLEKLQVNLVSERSLKDAGVGETSKLEGLNQERQELLSNLSETLKSHINRSSVLEEKKYTNQFLNNLKNPTVANNLEKFLPLIENVVRDPRKINDQETQSEMRRAIFRIENPLPPRPQLSSQEKLSNALSESREKLQQNFNLYQNFTLDRGLDGQYTFPEKKLNRIKNELINYLQIDKQLNPSGNSLDQQTKEFIDKVFKHEPNKTDNKLPFILQLVEQPQLVYDHQFQQQYNAEIGSQSIPNPTISSSDVKEYLKGLRSEIFERAKNQDLSSPEIQEKFQELRKGFLSVYSDKISQLTDEGKSLVQDVFSGQDIRKKLSYIGELITNPENANNKTFINEYHQQVYGGIEGKARLGVGNHWLSGSPDELRRRALQSLIDASEKPEAGGPRVQVSGGSFGRNSFAGEGKALGVSRGEARGEARGLPYDLQEVGDVVGSLQKKGNQTPSPSPSPVLCEKAKRMFGGVRSQGERSEGGQRRSEGGRRSGGNSRAFGRLFGAPRTLGQSGGR